MYRLVYDDNIDAYEGEKFLKNHPRAHFLQSFKWAKFKNCGHIYAVLSMDTSVIPSRVRGVMQFTPVRAIRGVGMFLYSPRGPVCDENDTEAMEDLIEGAYRMGCDMNSISICCDPDAVADSVFIKNFLKSGNMSINKDGFGNEMLQPITVFRKDLSGITTDEELMASFHSKTRNLVRSALKSGAKCYVSDDDRHIDDMVRLLTLTAKRDGFTPRTAEYFRSMRDNMKDDFKLFVVEYQGKLIAASVLIKYGKKAWHMFAGSDSEYSAQNPNYLMQWEMMRWCIQNGVTLYDMRGIAGEKKRGEPIPGLVHFKKRFGGEFVTFAGRYDLVTSPLLKNEANFWYWIKKLLGR